MISIIVPVYNVEQYLVRCLNSIINQTYKELEIILIDDGSTDNSGKICDEYALKDKRIRVIHKQNGGVSSARNAGLDIATGEYIGFVDSDDYIAPSMYEALLSKMNNKDIGIVSCDYYKVFSHSNIIKKNSNEPIINEVLVSSQKYDRFALLRIIQPNIWCKLYRREVIDKIRFKIGKLSEDYFFLHDIAINIKRNKFLTLLIPKNMYYYENRIGSACNTNWEQILIDLLNELNLYIEEYSKINSALVQDAKTVYLKHLCNLVAIISNSNSKKHNLYKKYHKELYNYTDIEAKSILSISFYNSYIYMKYFPNEFSLLISKKIPIFQKKIF